MVHVFEPARVEDFDTWSRVKKRLLEILTRKKPHPQSHLRPGTVQPKNAVILARLGLLLWLISLAIVLVSAAPRMLYWAFPGLTDVMAQKLGTTVDVKRSGFGDELYQAPTYVPPFDPSLPKENRLIIDKIGFTSTIQESSDPVKAMEVGAWRLQNSGTPDDRSQPMIFAAHRFGYLKWSNLYRRQNSFYNLPKLENGDVVTVIWGQRQYEYQIYEGYTDNQLHNINGDLILFTCELLNSDQRIVRHARLIQPTT
jgi:hypothetical protein